MFTLEDLKFALLNHCDDSGLYRFVEEANSILVVYEEITLNGTANEILVCYDPKVAGLFDEAKYLNESNTIKYFQDVYSAINYLKYLVKVKKDIRHELYYYFLFKLKKLKIEYEYLQFTTVSDGAAIRSDIGGLKLNGKLLLYNFIFISKGNGSCELTFYPEHPLWDEGKVCPESTVDSIMNYISRLEADNYTDIPLEEQ